MKWIFLTLLLLPATALASTSTNEKAAAGASGAASIATIYALARKESKKRKARRLEARAKTHVEILAQRYKWTEARKKREVDNLIRRGMR